MVNSKIVKLMFEESKFILPHISKESGSPMHQMIIFFLEVYSNNLKTLLKSHSYEDAEALKVWSNLIYLLKKGIIWLNFISN